MTIYTVFHYNHIQLYGVSQNVDPMIVAILQYTLYILVCPKQLQHHINKTVYFGYHTERLNNYKMLLTIFFMVLILLPPLMGCRLNFPGRGTLL